MSLLVLEVMLAPLLAAQTISQLWAGVSFPAGQIVGPIAGFATVALIAIWVLVAILRTISEPGPADSASDHAAHGASTRSEGSVAENVGSGRRRGAGGGDCPGETAELGGDPGGDRGHPCRG